MRMEVVNDLAQTAFGVYMDLNISNRNNEL